MLLGQQFSLRNITLFKMSSLLSVLPDWCDIVINNRWCYALYRIDKTWSNAQDYCENEGGFLATIPNSAVNQALKDFALVEGKFIMRI